VFAVPKSIAISTENALKILPSISISFLCNYVIIGSFPLIKIKYSKLYFYMQYISYSKNKKRDGKHHLFFDKALKLG
jgi:hypothetical protein